MKETNVHSLILEKTERIEDEGLRNFINEILSFERSKLDREKYQYFKVYGELINIHAPIGEQKYSSDE
jgi:hypothetical protein